MKRLLLTIILGAALTGAFAEGTPTDTTKTDTLKHKGHIKIKLGYGPDGSELDINKTRDTTEEEHHHGKRPGFSIGITFSRFDLGLTTLIDHGSFTLQPQNQFLRYRSWKSSNVGFDVFQFGYRFDSSFKIYLSAGFDWTLFRLRDNITILPNQPVLTYRQDNINYSKNRFGSSYLRIPLSFDFRSKEDANGDTFHFVAGPIGGFLLNGRVKQISAQNGKQKFNDNYHFTTFRYGGFVRVGYGSWGIFAKYYANNMFENSPAQDDLRNFSFGFTLGF